MFDFCPHCGESIGQEQRPGQTIICRKCQKTIGTIPTPQPVIVVHQADELIQRGVAARCPVCGQLIEVKAAAGVRSLIPHFGTAGDRKLCPGAGKPLPEEKVSGPFSAAEKGPDTFSSGKDLSRYMTRDMVRVVSCRRGEQPRIEALTLEYLDKTDRVRIQIDALRDILGADFRLRDYPAALAKPHLAIWGNATACVIGKKHERGGYETMSDAEIADDVRELRERHELFFPAV